MASRTNKSNKNSSPGIELARIPNDLVHSRMQSERIDQSKENASPVSQSLANRRVALELLAVDGVIVVEPIIPAPRLALLLTFRPLSTSFLVVPFLRVI